MKRENEMVVLRVEQDLCFTDHEHHDKITTIEKKKNEVKKKLKSNDGGLLRLPSDLLHIAGTTAAPRSMQAETVSEGDRASTLQKWKLLEGAQF